MVSTWSLVNKFILKNELVVDIVIVPMVVYVVLLTGNFEGAKLVIAVVNSIIVSLTGTLIHMGLRARFLSAVVRGINSPDGDIARIKGKILNFPRYDANMAILRWTCGAALILLMLHLQTALEPKNMIPVLFIVPVVTPLNYILFYILSENNLSELLTDPRVREVTASENSYRTLGLISRTLILVVSIVLIPIVILGFFLYLINSQQLVLENFGLHMSFIAALTITAVAVSLYEMARNARNSIESMVSTLECMQNGILSVKTATLLATRELGIVGRYAKSLLGKLIENEALRKTLFQTIPDLVWFKDPDGVYLGCNHVFELFLGAKESEIIGKTDRDFMEKDLADFFSEQDRNAMNSGEPVKTDQWMTFASDGHSISVEAIKTPLYDNDGRIIGVLGIARDITERKRAEQELRESQRRLADIIAFFPEPTLVIDRDGRVISWNRAIENMTGVRAEEILGKGDYEYAIPFYGERRPILIDIALCSDPAIEKKYTTIWRNGEILFGEAFIPSLPGGVAYLSATASVLYNAQGEIIAAIECIRNDTERKRAEEALKKSNRLLEAVIKQAPFAVYLLEGDTNNIRVIIENDESKRIMGESIEGRTVIIADTEGLPTTRIFTTDGTKKIQLINMPSHRAFKGEHVVNEEVLFRHPDGTELMVQVSASPVYDQANEIIAVVVIFHDVTARKQAEEEHRKLEAQLIQAQKMEAIGLLAGGVAHDFNNLLTPIMGYAEMLKIDLTPNDPQQTNLSEIISAAESARTLVRQLLTFARRQTLEMKSVDLNRVVSRFENILQRTLHKNIIIKTQLSHPLSAIQADVGQVEQVIMNLAINAQDAMPEGGDLSIITSEVVLDDASALDHAEARPGPYVVIEINDTGVGMDGETRKKIFDPFFSTKESGKGTGLGLATVYGIVKQHGGHIAVSSEPGRGTSFRVYFPQHGATVVSTEAVPVNDMPLQGRETLLVVEDQDHVRIMMVRVLNRLGYQVLAANDVKSARKASNAYQDRIDLLITDIMLPDGSGMELYDSIATARESIKVLYMSGYPSDIISHHGIPDPGVRFIQKPFSLLDFSRKVRNILSS